MIIDLILDRKDGEPYNPKDFYTNVLAYEDVFKFEPTISKAMDYGEEEDVKRALCDYINRQNYNPSICDYINSVNWLTSSKKVVKSSTDWVNRVPDGINLFLYSRDNQAKDKRYFPVGDDWGQVDRLLYAKMFTKDDMQKALAAIEPQLPEGMSIQVRDAKGKVYYTYPNNLTSSHRPIKSSMETLELAYDAVNMVYKNLLNQPGQMYNKWFIKNGYGQDNAYIMAEHTDYSVRMFFTFTDTGFVYVEGYFTNGSSYDRKNITSWKFDNDEYPFEETTNHVKQVLDHFFDEGINVLRGEEVYNSRKSIKSAASKELKEAIAGLNDIEDEFALVDYVKKILKKNSMSNKFEAFCDETDKADTPEELGKVAEKYIRMAIKSSRKPIKSAVNSSSANEILDKLYECVSHRYYTHGDINGYSENDISPGEASDILGEILHGLQKMIDNLEVIVDNADDKEFENDSFGLGYDGLKDAYNKIYETCAEWLVPDSWEDLNNNIFVPIEKLIGANIESSHKPVKSSNRTWIAGKTENNNKLFYCEDGKFYPEEDFGRPSIQIFDNKDSAEKIAKRSKSGFIQILDDYDD